MDVVSIGKFIKQARKGLGLTQGHLAERLGVSPQAVSKWERGDNLPDVGLMPDLAEMLGVSIDEILGVEGEKWRVEQWDADEYALLTASQKAEVLGLVLRRREYDVLEEIAMYFTNDMKAEALAKLLAEDRLDIIEDIITNFNRKHRDMIVDYFIEKPSEEIENFVPFFDKNQINRIVEAQDMRQDEKENDNYEKNDEKN